jgi:Glucanosyltransferase
VSSPQGSYYQPVHGGDRGIARPLESCIPSLQETLWQRLIIAYHVDSTGNHDDCMQAFSDNGIYVFLDLDTFNTQIEETNPQWTYSQYTAFTAVIDAFAKYDNIAGFFVANEVCVPSSRSSPFASTVFPFLIRDLRFRGFE